MEIVEKEKKGEGGAIGNQWNGRSRKEIISDDSVFPSRPFHKLPKALCSLSGFSESIEWSHCRRSQLRRPASLTPAANAMEHTPLFVSPSRVYGLLIYI
ncbi:hypothetical protein U1Q18_008100 [Sarracenia purpurea var. burkii]